MTSSGLECRVFAEVVPLGAQFDVVQAALGRGGDTER